MAIPIALSNEISFYPDNDIFKILVMILFSIASTSVFCFIIDKDFEKQKKETTNETTNIKTPKRTKQDIQCPNAPKSKRQCLIKSPIISYITPRELFSSKEDNISTPNAPIKFDNQNTTFTMEIDDDTKRKLFVFNAGEKHTEERECPNAPIKVNKTEHKTNEVDVMVATKLVFDELMEPSIENLLSIPKNNEELSKETEFICSLYKPTTIIDDLINEINQNADKVDFNNPDRIIWNFNPAGISNYILTINKIYQSIKIINEKKIALTQNVNEITNTTKNQNKNDDDYRLIDKLINVVLTIQQLNLTLSDRLLMVYNNCSHTWMSIPNSYVQACKLSHDASILQKKIFDEVWYNMNLTPWSEW